MDMLTTSNIHSLFCCTTKFVMVTITRICFEFHFVNMAAFTWNGITGNSCKSMIVGIFAASGNGYAVSDSNFCFQYFP